MGKKEIMEFLKNIKGRIDYEQQAKSWSWLQTGGKPIFTFEPESDEDLKFFIKNKPKELKFRTFGAGSNILIRDNGYNGVFIRLKKGFRGFEVENENITIGSGLTSKLIVHNAMLNELGNIEFMQTIPGMLGGMIKMNAGAHQQEMKDIINWVEIMDENGEIHRINNVDCGFSYRHSKFQNDWVILRANLKCVKKAQTEIIKKINELNDYRAKTQPTAGKMAGCFFKNDVNEKAWKLVKDSCVNDFENVKISSIHANFLMNQGNASAYEIEFFAKTIQAAVFLKNKIMLQMEVETIGY